MSSAPYREAPKYQVRIVRVFWKSKGDAIPNENVKAMAALAEMLNDGWQIVGQSEFTTDTAGWTTYTLTRLR